jgi:hypothetical protein
MDGVTTNNNFLGEIPTNPLDQFDNVTYNIKLYLIPPDEDIKEDKLLLEEDFLMAPLLQSQKTQWY